MEKERKKFKDTKFGKLLTEKIPNAAGVIGDLLPNSGVLGVAKNLIDNATLDPQEKQQLLSAQLEYEREILAIEAADRDSARAREISFLDKMGSRDAMQTITGSVGLLAFIFMLIILAFFELPPGNKEIFIHAVGIIEGVAISLFTYYFGSSSGSKEKDKLLKL
jgi:hypothetical protein